MQRIATYPLRCCQCGITRVAVVLDGSGMTRLLAQCFVRVGSTSQPPCISQWALRHWAGVEVAAVTAGAAGCCLRATLVEAAIHCQQQTFHTSTELFWWCSEAVRVLDRHPSLMQDLDELLRPQVITELPDEPTTCCCSGETVGELLLHLLGLERRAFAPSRGDRSTGALSTG